MPRLSFQIYGNDKQLTHGNNHVVPPSRNATLDDVMEFEFAPNITIGERMSPTANGLCYIYE
jgi:hypothetical protein